MQPEKEKAYQDCISAFFVLNLNIPGYFDNQVFSLLKNNPLVLTMPW